MLRLDNKYVFHIPLYKYEDNKLIRLDIDGILANLMEQLNNEGYESLYITEVKSYFKSRSFDELLVTLFISQKRVSDNKQELPDKVFKRWFKQNNHILRQEAFAYEHNNSMIIESLRIDLV